MAVLLRKGQVPDIRRTVSAHSTRLNLAQGNLVREPSVFAHLPGILWGIALATPQVATAPGAAPDEHHPPMLYVFSVKLFSSRPSAGFHLAPRGGTDFVDRPGFLGAGISFNADGDHAQIRVGIQ